MNLLHQPVRMHIASIGVSKFCFLFSLAFCGLLLLLIPALQPLPRQVDLPKPRPQARPAQVGTSHQVRVPGVFLHAGKKEITAGLNRSSEGLGKPIKTEISRNSYPKTGKGVRRIPERGIGGPQEYRSHDKLELKDIFIAVKTTRKYHKSRLELLIQTWVSQAKEQVSTTPVFHVAVHPSVHLYLLGFPFVDPGSGQVGRPGLRVLVSTRMFYCDVHSKETCSSFIVPNRCQTETILI